MTVEFITMVAASATLGVAAYAVYLAWSTQKVLEKSHGILEDSNKVLKGTRKVLKGTQKVLKETHTLIDDWAFVSMISDALKSNKEQVKTLSLIIDLREFAKSGPHTKQELEAFKEEMERIYPPTSEASNAD